MIWHNVRILRNIKTKPCTNNKSQVRHESRKFLISPSFYPQNNRKPIQQLPRSKSAYLSVNVGGPQFYRRPVIKHNVIRAAREKLLQDASANRETTTPLRIQQLDPEVEDAVGKDIQRWLNFFTSEWVRQYGSTKHSDIALSIPGYLDRHQLRSEPVKLMWSALRDILPEDPLNPTIETAAGQMSHKRFRFLKSYDDVTPALNRMGLGWYLLRSGSVIHPDLLLEDGTNRRFLPGPASAWAYRLWAGGSITQNSRKPLVVDTGQTIHKTERVLDFRIDGCDRPERVFVTIQKDFFLIDKHWLETSYTKQNVVNALTRQSDKAHKQPQTTETYTLCFPREPPEFTGPPRIVSPPRTVPKFKHTLTPTRHLLFCWSALTYNAHLIHFDTEYVQKVYKAPNLLVHGPLTAFIALEWFERVITKHAIEREFPPFELRAVTYKNLSPLYVDEAMTLCTKPTKFPTPGTLADSWDVWIEKKVKVGEEEQEKSTMAFKATIRLAVGEEALERGIIKHGRAETDKRKKEAEESEKTATFSSPFF